MNRKIVSIIGIFSLCISLVISNPKNVEAQEESVPKFILDVDMSTDVDDILAVRTAENLDKNGEENLLAVMMSVSGGENALSGLLTYDGYGDIPVGIYSGSLYEDSPYWDYLDGISGINEEIDAVTLYRKILSESKDKVSILTTGYLGNISRLLQSGPDEYSELTGEELIAQKCKAIHIMGGGYPEGFDNNLAATDEALDASTYVFKYWPEESPLIIYTNNLGNWITTGEDLSCDDPAKACFILAGKATGGASWDNHLVWSFGIIESGKASDYGISFERSDVHMIYGTKDVAIHDTSVGNKWRVVVDPSYKGLHEIGVKSAYQT